MSVCVRLYVLECKIKHRYKLTTSLWATRVWPKNANIMLKQQTRHFEEDVAVCNCFSWPERPKCVKFTTYIFPWKIDMLTLSPATTSSPNQWTIPMDPKFICWKDVQCNWVCETYKLPIPNFPQGKVCKMRPASSLPPFKFRADPLTSRHPGLWPPSSRAFKIQCREAPPRKVEQRRWKDSAR